MKNGLSLSHFKCLKMKKIIIFISLFIGIFFNINAQSITANQLNGRLSIQTATLVADSTWSISGYFSHSTGKFTTNQIAVNDRFFIQIGANTYVGRISVVNSVAVNLITFRVICNYPNPPNGVGAIIRPTSNGYPVYVDGIANNLQAGIQNYFATLVNTNAAGNFCEQTLTKTGHGFRKWTPIYWNGSTWVRPTNDTIIPTYIVIDSTSANTFKVANCGNYSTTLSTGMYWFTGTSPGYTTTAPTVKTPLFEVAQGRLILQPLTGFNLASSGVDKNGIYSGSDSLTQFNTYAKMSGTQVYAQGKFPGFPFYSLYDKVSGLFLSSYENSFIHGLGDTYSVVGASPDATYSLSRNKIIDNRRSSIFSYPGKISLSVGYDKTWQITIDTSKFEIVRYASGALRSYNLLPASEWPETTANSISQLAWTAGSPSFLRSQHGVATGTTDANGDLTLTLPAAMPDNTYTMLITVEGTTSRLYTVHTKGTSSCKVRFYGATTGSALPTTSVSISYEAKNY